MARITLQVAHYYHSCRGIWLDQGELSRLLREEHAERQPPHRENRSRKQHADSHSPGLHALLSLRTR